MRKSRATFPRGKRTRKSCGTRVKCCRQRAGIPQKKRNHAAIKSSDKRSQKAKVMNAQTLPGILCEARVENEKLSGLHCRMKATKLIIVCIVCSIYGWSVRRWPSGNRVHTRDMVVMVVAAAAAPPPTPSLPSQPPWLLLLPPAVIVVGRRRRYAFNRRVWIRSKRDCCDV